MPVYVVYVLASWSRVLYIGVTSDLKRRVWEHREKFVDGFTARYKVDKLVYLEVFRDVEQASFGVSRHPVMQGIDQHDPAPLGALVLCVDAVKPPSSSSV